MIKQRIVILVALALVSTVSPTVYQYAIEPRSKGVDVYITVNNIEYDPAGSNSEAIAFTLYLKLDNNYERDVILSPFELDAYYLSDDAEKYYLVGKFETNNDFVIPGKNSVAQNSTYVQSISENNLGTNPVITRKYNGDKTIKGTLYLSKESGFLEGSNQALAELINTGLLKLTCRGDANYGPISITMEKDISISMNIISPDFVLWDLFLYADPLYPTTALEDTFVLHTKVRSQNASNIPFSIRKDSRLDLYDLDESYTEEDSELGRADSTSTGKKKGWGLSIDQALKTRDPDARKTGENVNLRDQFLNKRADYEFERDNLREDCFFAFNMTDPVRNSDGSEEEYVSWLLSKLIESPTVPDITDVDLNANGLELKGPAYIRLGEGDGAFDVDMTDPENYLSIKNIVLYQFDRDDPKAMLGDFQIGSIIADKITVDTEAETVSINMSSTMTLKNKYRFSYNLEDFDTLYYHDTSDSLFASTDIIEDHVIQAATLTEKNSADAGYGKDTTINLDLSTTYNTKNSDAGFYKILSDLGVDPYLMDISNPFYINASARPEEHANNPLETIKFLINLENINPLTDLNEVSLDSIVKNYNPLECSYFGTDNLDLSEGGDDIDAQPTDSPAMPYIGHGGDMFGSVGGSISDVPDLNSEDWDWYYDDGVGGNAEVALHRNNSYEMIGYTFNDNWWADDDKLTSTVNRIQGLITKAPQLPPGEDYTDDTALYWDDDLGGYVGDRSGAVTSTNHSDIAWRVYHDTSGWTSDWGHYWGTEFYGNGRKGCYFVSELDTNNRLMLSQNFTLDPTKFPNGRSDIEEVTLSFSYRYENKEDVNDLIYLLFGFHNVSDSDEDDDDVYQYDDFGVLNAFGGREGIPMSDVANYEWNHFSLDLTTAFKNRIGNYTEKNDMDYLRGETSIAAVNTGGTQSLNAYFDDIVLNVKYKDYIDDQFVDNFNDASRDDKWVDTPNNGEISESGGRLNFKVVSDIEHEWDNETANAPYCLMEFDDYGQDWAASVHIPTDFSVGETGNLHHGGLVIYEDDGSAILWGKAREDFNNTAYIYSRAYQIDGDDYLLRTSKSAADDYDYYRIKKYGGSYYFEHSKDGITWINCWNLNDPYGFKPTKVGLFHRGFGDDYQSLNISFDNWKIKELHGVDILQLFEYLEEKDPHANNFFTMFQDLSHRGYIDGVDFFTFLADDELGNDKPDGDGMDIFDFFQLNNVSFSAMTDLLSVNYTKLGIGEKVNFLEMLQKSRYKVVEPGEYSSGFPYSPASKYGPRIYNPESQYWTIEDPYNASKAIMNMLYENIFRSSSGALPTGENAKLAESDLWYMLECLGVSPKWVMLYLLTQGWTKHDIFDALEACGFAKEINTDYASGRSWGRLNAQFHIMIQYSLFGWHDVYLDLLNFDFDMGDVISDGLQELFDVLCGANTDPGSEPYEDWEIGRPIIDYVGTPGEGKDPDNPYNYAWDPGYHQSSDRLLDIGFGAMVQEFALQMRVHPASTGILPTHAVYQDYITTDDEPGFNNAGTQQLASNLRIYYKFQGEDFIIQGGDIVSLFQFLDDYYFGEYNGVPCTSHTLLNYFDVSSKDFVDIITGYNRSAGKFDTNGNGKADEWKAPDSYGAGNRDSYDGFGLNFRDNRIYHNPNGEMIKPNLGQEEGKIIWTDSPDLAGSDADEIYNHTLGIIDEDDDISEGAPPIVDLIDMLTWISLTSGALDPNDLFEWLLGEKADGMYDIISPSSGTGTTVYTPGWYGRGKGITNQLLWRTMRTASLNSTGFFTWLEEEQNINSFRFLYMLNKSTGLLGPLNLLYFSMSPNMIRFEDGSLSFVYHDALHMTNAEEAVDRMWRFFSENLTLDAIRAIFEYINGNNVDIFDMFMDLDINVADWMNLYNHKYGIEPFELLKRMKKLNTGAAQYLEFESGYSTVVDIRGNFKITYGGTVLDSLSNHPIKSGFSLTVDTHFSNFIDSTYLKGERFIIK